MLAGMLISQIRLRWWWKSRRDKVPSQPRYRRWSDPNKRGALWRRFIAARPAHAGAEAHVIARRGHCHAVIELEAGAVPKGEPGRDDIADVFLPAPPYRLRSVMR